MCAINEFLSSPCMRSLYCIVCMMRLLKRIWSLALFCELRYRWTLSCSTLVYCWSRLWRWSLRKTWNNKGGGNNTMNIHEIAGLCISNDSLNLLLVTTVLVNTCFTVFQIFKWYFENVLNCLHNLEKYHMALSNIVLTYFKIKGKSVSC